MRALYILAAVLVILWLLGAVVLKVTSGIIHLLLLAAIVLVVINLVKGRRTV